MTSDPDDSSNADWPSSEATERAELPLAEVGINDTSGSALGRSYVGTADAIIMLAIILLLTATTVYCLIALWPPGTNEQFTTSSVFSVRVSPNPSQGFFAIVGLSGALGGLIHSLRSLYWYIGNRVLRRSWIFMYFSLPIVGAALAIVFGLVLRGGLLVDGGSGTQINYFGFAAISALVGIFSPEAAEKLKQVFSTILTPAESGRDRTPPITYAVIDGLEPRNGIPGSTVTVHGSSLTQTTAVLFHGARTLPTRVSYDSVTVQVPDGASTGPVRLIIADQIIRAPWPFHVE